MRVLGERIEKIARWPTPSGQHRVRAFLGVVGITKRWVENYAELSRPLARLTGKVPFRWAPSEQLSFEILKIKCCTRTAMYGIDLSKPVHFYTDASAYAAGLAITQCLPAAEANVPAATGVPAEVPIIYDSFPFTATQRRYPTYKRELYAIVIFVNRYDLSLQAPLHTSNRSHGPQASYLFLEI